MSRETSPFEYRGYWLDKRRDGKSPDVWQIAAYSNKSRSVVYRSTKRGTVDVEGAKAVLLAYEADQRSRSKGQSADHSALVPHLFNYLREHGPDVKRDDTIKSSFRAWIGFLQQDELGTGAVIADVTKSMVARFRRWRMGPHSYSVEWGGKTFGHTSKGVTGETVQRNIEDLRAALHHAEGEGRITAPKVPSVDRKLRSGPRETLLTVKQLGAIMGYARDDIDAWRWIALMLATAARPGAALAFDPADQWLDDIIDLQPVGVQQTDKRNAVVPVIEPLRPILEGWLEAPGAKVKSRKKWWGTMRRVIGLPSEITAYTVRHTVATFMDSQGVPGAQMSAIAGHIPAARGIARTTSRNYLHYDPRNCPQAISALTTLFSAVEREAASWRADQVRTTPVRGKPISLARPVSNA
jgi:hypothetical protein